MLAGSKSTEILHPIAKAIRKAQGAANLITDDMATAIEMPVRTLKRLRKLTPEDSVAYVNLRRIVYGLESLARQSDTFAASKIREARRLVLHDVDKQVDGGIPGLYSQWVLEHGKEHCARTIGLTDHKLRNLRSSSRTSDINFRTLLEESDKLCGITGDISPDKRWNSLHCKRIRKAMRVHGRKLGRPSLLIDFEMMLTILGEKVHKECKSNIILGHKIDGKACYDIAHYRFVEFDLVKPIYEQLLSFGFLRGNELDQVEMRWRSDYSSQSNWEHVELGKKAKENGIHNSALALALSASEKKELSTDNVWRYLDGRHTYSYLPVGVLAHLILTSEQAKETVSRAHTERIDALTRIGYYKKNVKLTAALSIWGVSLRDLDYPLDELKKLEERGRGPLTNQAPDIVTEIERIGMSKVVRAKKAISADKKTVLKGKPKAQLEQYTLRRFFSELQYTDLVAVNSHTAIYIEGASIPHLQKTQEYLSKANPKSKSALHASWYNEFALSLKAQNYPDLARILLTYIAQKYPSVDACLKANGANKITQRRADMATICRYGAIQEDKLEKLLKALQIDADSPLSTLVKKVNQLGTIIKSLPSIVESLGSQLNADIVYCSKQFNGESHAATLSKDRDGILSNKLISVLGSIPGVGFEEIQSINSEQEDELAIIYQSLLSRVRSKGIDDRMLFYAANRVREGCTNGDFCIFKVMLEQACNNCAVPIGTLAVLAPIGSDDYANLKEQVEDAIRAEYLQLGVEATDLMVQLAFWGLQVKDIVAKHYNQKVHALFKTQRTQDSQLAVVQNTNQFGEDRTLNIAKIIRSLTGEYASIIPHIDFYHDVVRQSGKQREIDRKAGVGDKLIADYQSGKAFPAFCRFQKMLKAIGIKEKDYHHVTWLIHYADQSAEPPLLRVVYARLLSGKHSNAKAFEEFDRTISSMRTRYGVAEGFVRKYSLLNGARKDKATQVIARVADNQYAPEDISFLLACLGHSREQNFNFIDLVVKYKGDILQAAIEYIEANESRYLKALNYVSGKIFPTKLPRLQLTPKLQSDVQNLMIDLSGINFGELRKLYLYFFAYEELRLIVREEDKIEYLRKVRENGVELGLENPLKGFRKPEANADVAVRSVYLSRLLKGPLQVEDGTLHKLFSEQLSDIVRICAFMGHDHACWYIASIQYFQNPREAFKEMARQVGLGLESFLDGRDFYMTVENLSSKTGPVELTKIAEFI